VILKSGLEVTQDHSN